MFAAQRVDLIRVLRIERSKRRLRVVAGLLLFPTVENWPLFVLPPLRVRILTRQWEASIDLVLTRLVNCLLSGLPSSPLIAYRRKTFLQRVAVTVSRYSLYRNSVVPRRTKNHVEYLEIAILTRAKRDTRYG